MKLVAHLAVILSLGLSAFAGEKPTVPAKEKQRYLLYAEMKIGFYVDLHDGMKWGVERGDTFPVIMFKEERTKVILQLAGASFWINAEWVTPVESKDLTPAQIASYRKQVEKYLEHQAAEWKTKAGVAK